MTSGRSPASVPPNFGAERHSLPSYYAATSHPAPARPPLSEDLDVEVCVIGGGYTGLSAALELAERGHEVAVVEARRVGWGASGRNGGQICSGMPTAMARIESWVGREDALALFRLAEEGKALVAQRIARYAIDCDLSWGYVEAAHGPRDMAGLKATKSLWEGTYGYRGLDILDREELAGHIVSPAYVGGLYDPGAGQLHPLNYCLGLARAAAEAGVRIFEDTPVARLEGVEGTQPIAVTTETGTIQAGTTQTGTTQAGGNSGGQRRIRARVLVLACNAYLDNLVPRLEAQILPVGTYIAATEPLGDLARALMPSGAAAVDCKRMLNYYRMTKDGRLLFGARTGAIGLEQHDPGPALRRQMAKVFPGLAEARFDYLWGGRVAITTTRTPQVGRLGPATYFAQGYSGHGVALTGAVGRVIAEAVAGETARLKLLERLPRKRFPGGRHLRLPGLALGIAWHRFLDALGR